MPIAVASSLPLLLSATLMAATCSQSLQLGCQLPQEGSGESLYNVIRANYSNELCRVLASFNEHARALYSLESKENACTELLNQTQNVAAVETDSKCRMQLECSVDNSRFPPVIASGRCLNNYCSAGGAEHTGRLYPCRPERKRVLVLRYYGEDGTAANTPPSITSLQAGQWRLRRERIVTDCYCALPRYRS